MAKINMKIIIFLVSMLLVAPISIVAKKVLWVVRFIMAFARKLAWRAAFPIRWLYQFIAPQCDPYLYGALKKTSFLLKMVQVENLRLRVPVLLLSMFYISLIMILAIGLGVNGYVPVIISTKEESFAQVLLESNAFTWAAAFINAFVSSELLAASIILGFLLLLLKVLLRKAKKQRAYNIPIGVITGKLLHMVYTGWSKYAMAGHKEQLAQLGGILVLKNDQASWWAEAINKLIDQKLSRKESLAKAQGQTLDLSQFDKDELAQILLSSETQDKNVLSDLCVEYLNSHVTFVVPEISDSGATFVWIILGFAFSTAVVLAYHALIEAISADPALANSRFGRLALEMPGLHDFAFGFGQLPIGSVTMALCIFLQSGKCMLNYLEVWWCELDEARLNLFDAGDIGPNLDRNYDLFMETGDIEAFIKSNPAAGKRVQALANLMDFLVARSRESQDPEDRIWLLDQLDPQLWTLEKKDLMNSQFYKKFTSASPEAEFRSEFGLSRSDYLDGAAKFMLAKRKW